MPVDNAMLILNFLSRNNIGLTDLETLIDIVVHGQDIAIPLSRQLAVPVEVAATAATRVWSYRASRRERWKARVFRPLPYECYRFAATGTSWSVGSGPEIRGPILAILLVLTGRPAWHAWPVRALAASPPSCRTWVDL